MRLQLNLAVPRQAPSRAGWLLLAAGLACALWAGWRHGTAQAEFERQQARLAQLTPKPVKAKPVRAAKGEESPVLAKARSLLAADWPALLAELEQSRPDTIAFLSVEAEAGGGVLNLNGEAKDHAAMLAYVKQLESESALRDVALASHADVEAAGEKAVDFVLRARWRTP